MVVLWKLFVVEVVNYFDVIRGKEEEDDEEDDDIVWFFLCVFVCVFMFFDVRFVKLRFCFLRFFG